MSLPAITCRFVSNIFLKFWWPVCLYRYRQVECFNRSETVKILFPSIQYSKTLNPKLVLVKKTEIWRHLGSLAPPHAPSSDPLSLLHSLSSLLLLLPQPRLPVPISSLDSLICSPFSKILVIISTFPRKTCPSSQISDLELLGFRPLLASGTTRVKVINSVVVAITRMLRGFPLGLTFICLEEFSLTLSLPASISQLGLGCSLGLVCGKSSVLFLSFFFL